MDLSYQANQQQSADPRGGGSIQTKTRPLTRILLLCGAIAGPLFIFTVLIQDYTRPGFDPRLDPLSLLSLGDWGWVQIVNFALAGVLILLIFFTGFSNAAFMARTLRLATLIGWMAASLVAIKLLSTPDTPQQTRDH